MSAGVVAIAGNTFREVIRDRVLYLLVFFSLVLMALGWALGWISIEEERKLVTDLSLAAISLFALLITIFLGASLIYKEVDKRTLYTILSKDVGRTEFVLGKFVGLMALFGVCIALMGLAFAGNVLIAGGGLNPTMLAALYGLLLELTVITSFSIAFAMVTSPVLSAISTLGFYLVGHSTEILVKFTEGPGHAGYRPYARALYYVFPNLENFNLRYEAAYGIPVDAVRLGLMTGYAALFAGLFLGVAALVFRRKSF
jgi:ABC-type transport system involved in multi-copper enzyme maturation permease subunit